MKNKVTEAPAVLGLKENLGQFSLLVLINAFVGGMIGMERTILPELAEKEFKIEAASAILSFIVVFGIIKAVTNYFSGRFADKYGRKNMLLTGWLFGLPVPFILMWADSWNWVIFANVLLGINQGLAWSSTVMMKIDLAGSKQRGLAMGLNEFAGYLAVAASAFITGWIAGNYNVRPYPFYLGAVLSLAGLILTFFFVKDTHNHVAAETAASPVSKTKNIFWFTTWKNRNLSAVTQAGLINNLNDGMMWGIFPVLLAAKKFPLQEIGLICAIYPAVWGAGQIITGKIADHVSKKKLLYTGMLLQGFSLLFLIFAGRMRDFTIISILLGAGTAMVYPTFLASIAEHTHPADRAQSLGTFRLWRDLGYAAGAVLTGIIMDLAGMNSAIIFTGGITILSGMIVFIRMK